MAKPFVTKSKKTVTLKRNDKQKTYESWSLRVTAYDRELQAVRQKYLKGLGQKPEIAEDEAKAIVEEFGDQFGFTLEDLLGINNLKILSGTTNGGERDTKGNT